MPTNCPSCGTQNSDDSKYCKGCGARLTTGTYVACRKCGASNQPASVFCHMCGERLSGLTKTSSESTSSTAPAVLSSSPKASAVRPLQQQAPASAPEDTGTATEPAEGELLPDWLERLYKTSADKTLPIKARLVPTHELLRMASAINIDVDYSTLRFWQKRGLVPKPVRGPVDAGRGTRGYYDPSLIDRLRFIREIQKNYSIGLEDIRRELDQIDQQVTQSGGQRPQRLFQARLGELQTQRAAEARMTLLSVICKALGLDSDDVATIVVRKKDGETIRFLPGRASAELEKQPVEKAP